MESEPTDSLENNQPVLTPLGDERSVQQDDISVTDALEVKMVAIPVSVDATAQSEPSDLPTSQQLPLDPTSEPTNASLLTADLTPPSGLTREQRSMDYWPSRIEKLVEAFLASNEDSYVFDSSLSTYARRLVHMHAADNGFVSMTESAGRGNKAVVIYRSNHLRVQRHSQSMSVFYQQISTYDYVMELVDASTQVTPLFHPTKDLKRVWGQFYKGKEDYVNNLLDTYFENHWDGDFVEVHNPLGEPPGTIFLLIYLTAYEKLKAELEHNIGDELPTIIPSCFGPRSKFYSRKFQSSQECKQFVDQTDRGNQRLKHAKISVMGKKQLARSLQTIFQNESGQLVAIDFEAFEFDSSVLLEVGISTSSFSRRPRVPDTRPVIDEQEQEITETPKRLTLPYTLTDYEFSPVETKHYIYTENRVKKNHVFVKDNRSHFSFGESIELPAKEINEILANVIRECTVVVFHNDNAELHYLKVCDINVGKTVIADTQKIAFLMEDTIINGALKLGALVELLTPGLFPDLPMHNAGNDAHCTLVCFLEMLKKFEAIGIQAMGSAPTPPVMASSIGNASPNNNNDNNSNPNSATATPANSPSKRSKKNKKSKEAAVLANANQNQSQPASPNNSTGKPLAPNLTHFKLNSTPMPIASVPKLSPRALSQLPRDPFITGRYSPRKEQQPQQQAAQFDATSMLHVLEAIQVMNAAILKLNDKVDTLANKFDVFIASQSKQQLQQLGENDET